MALSTFVESVLYGVAPNDPLVLFGAAVLLGTASVVACWLPARRGASSDPMTILREV